MRRVCAFKVFNGARCGDTFKRKQSFAITPINACQLTTPEIALMNLQCQSSHYTPHYVLITTYNLAAAYHLPGSPQNRVSRKGRKCAQFRSTQTKRIHYHVLI